MFPPGCGFASRFYPELRITTSGAIFCDHEGMVLVGFSSTTAETFDAPSFEAFALSCAIQKALDKGFSGVVLESDYAFIINKLIFEL
ncbi:hypothetical protein PVK06_003451 [Gossypium arboreum]|uniref:RNase H type-1 domain-containing protein n=1 Tax=Gossypium arboreum TaxID=29729 RepID=A0ABR0R7S6_GOSAR|nr:hypothetical protein PVK06_003451 [Gossypium arboreum]